MVYGALLGLLVEYDLSGVLRYSTAARAISLLSKETWLTRRTCDCFSPRSQIPQILRFPLQISSPPRSQVSPQFRDFPPVSQISPQISEIGQNLKFLPPGAKVAISGPQKCHFLPPRICIGPGWSRFRKPGEGRPTRDGVTRFPLCFPKSVSLVKVWSL